MSASAVVMMAASIALVWGGLVAAVVNLMRSRDPVPNEANRDL